MPSNCIVRARYTDDTVRLYQAYSPEIALPALKAGRFVPPFSMGRMTWIKPSFHWMMYRSGYATKPGQEVVLAIDISRAGFEWALRHAVLSSFKPGFHASHDEWTRQVATRPVRIQWDPERDWRIQPVPDTRAIQIGIQGEAVELYVNHWTRAITDVTPLARELADAVARGVEPASLPSALEMPYPLDARVAAEICPA